MTGRSLDGPVQMRVAWYGRHSACLSRVSLSIHPGSTSSTLDSVHRHQPCPSSLCAGLGGHMWQALGVPVQGQSHLPGASPTPQIPVQISQP